MKHIEEEGDQEVLENVDTMLKNLREKEEKYEELVALNQTLIVKERKSNDELQEALKELVNVRRLTMACRFTGYWNVS